MEAVRNTDKTQTTSDPKGDALDAHKAGSLDHRPGTQPAGKNPKAQETKAQDTSHPVIENSKLVIPDKSIYPAGSTEDPSKAQTTKPGDTTAKPSDSTAKPNTPAPTEKPLDQNALEKDALAIRAATGNDNLVFRWADKDKINKILEGKSEAERKVIDDYYKKHFNVSLEAEMRKFESGSDLDKFLNLLNKKDGDIANENARRIHEDLLEQKNWIGGRSSTEIENDVRALLSTQTSEQVKKIADEYQKTYGVSLADAIKNNSSVSDATKSMVDVYLHDGADHRSAADTNKLIDTAIANKNMDQFAEAMASATPDQRKAFLANNGEQRLKDAFGHWWSDSDLKHALDYAHEGKLDATTQVADNTHIFSNKQGVELALQKMTADERQMYINGKSIAEGKPSDAANKLSPEEQTKASQYYDKMHTALTAAGNNTDLAKWEDAIANNGQGSFVSRMAAHRGMLWNDNADSVANDIRNMTEQDWTDAKKHPERREELRQMLTSLNENDIQVKDALAIYDKMVAADSFDKAKNNGKESVLNQINDNTHWYGDDRGGVLSAIAGMSTDEQEKYRTDATFRKQIDDKIVATIQDSEGIDAAHRMLDQINNKKAPDSDLIANLERTGGNSSHDAAMAIDKAFKDDPTLKDRLTNPQTDADRALAAKYKAAVEYAFGDDYEVFGKPYVEKGQLSLETKLSLEQGVFSNDYDKINEDIKAATPEERARLQSDSTYREKVLGFMGKDRQEIALAVAAQNGETKPEDRIRAATIGWGGSADIVNELKAMKPENLAKAESEYARKYGSSLRADLESKLGGKDRLELERVFTSGMSLEERTNIAREQTENARSGIGAWTSDHVFGSGTGAQADNAMAQTNAALTEKHKMDQAVKEGTALVSGMTPEQVKAAQAKVDASLQAALENENKATDNHIESKQQIAEYAGDAAVAAAAVGTLILTGGADAPLLVALACAAEGAALKVGTNALLEGNDYDWSTKNVGKDIAIGLVTGGTAGLGGPEIAGVLRIGSKAAEEAAVITLDALGSTALKEGGEQLLKEGTQDIIRQTLVSGAKKLSEKQFTELAESVISPELTGAAREQAVREMAATLEKNVSERMATGIVRAATHHALNAGAGSLGGAAGGVVQGVSEWDSRKTLAANLSHIAETSSSAAISGFIGGGAMSVSMAGVGKIWTAARGALSKEKLPPVVETPVPPEPRTGLQQADAVGGTLDTTKVVATTVVADGALEAADEIGKKAVDQATRAHGQPNTPVEAQGVNNPTGNKNNQAHNDTAPAPASTAHIEGEPKPNKPVDSGETPRQTDAPKASTEAGPEAPVKKTDVDERPREVVAPGDKPAPVEVKPERIKEVSKELAERQNRPQIERESFNRLLDQVPAADRKLAIQVLEASTPNEHRKILDYQLEQLTKQLKELRPGAEKITVVAMGDDESSKALGYLLRTNANIDKGVDIRVLDKATMEAGLGKATGPVLVFDDLARATPEQKAFLKNLPDFYATDLGGFDKGLNLFDLSLANQVPQSMETVQEKLRDLVAEVKAIDKKPIIEELRQKAEQDIATAKANGTKAPEMPNDEQLAREATSLATKRVLTEPLDTAAAEYSNVKVLRPQDVEIGGRNGRLKKTNVNDAMTMYYNDVLKKPLVSVDRGAGPNQLTGATRLSLNPVQQSDVETFLSKKYMRPDTKTPYSPREQLALGLMLKDGMINNTYDQLIDRLRQLPAKIEKELPAGKSMQDIVILTQIENNGSANLVQHLYQRLNGLRPEQFVSVAELARNPKAFQGKVMVYLDDYVYSGQQLVGHMDAVLPTAPGAKGQIIGDLVKKADADLIVAQLAGYKELNSIDMLNKPAALIYGSDELLPQFYDSPELRQIGFTQEELRQLAGAPKWEDRSGSIEVGAINPYRSHPTNNPRIVREFNTHVLKDRNYNSYRGVERSSQQGISQAGDHLWRGGSPKSALDFQKIVEKTDADVVIDLRGATSSSTEEKSIAREIGWAQNNPGKKPEMVNVKIPTEMPAVGTVEYDAMLEQLHTAAETISKNVKDGKNVFIHCYHGRDRTGLVNALYDAVYGGKSIDEALAKWSELGNTEREAFHSLYDRDKFIKLVEDYRAKYGM